MFYRSLYNLLLEPNPVSTAKQPTRVKYFWIFRASPFQTSFCSTTRFSIRAKCCLNYETAFANLRMEHRGATYNKISSTVTKFDLIIYQQIEFICGLPFPKQILFLQQNIPRGCNVFKFSIRYQFRIIYFSSTSRLSLLAKCCFYCEVGFTNVCVTQQNV